MALLDPSLRRVKKAFPGARPRAEPRGRRARPPARGRKEAARSLGGEDGNAAARPRGLGPSRAYRLEYRAGYLLSDALAYYLAEAKKVIALDYHPILDLEQSRRAAVTSERARILAALERFASVSEVGERLDRLNAL